MDRDVLTASQLLCVQSKMMRSSADLCDVLVAKNILTPDRYADLRADWMGAPRAKLTDLCPDPALLSDAHALDYLKHLLLPIRTEGDVTYVATARPDKFDAAIQAVGQDLGRVAPIVTTAEALQTRIAQIFREQLRHKAQNRVAEHESCRGWGHSPQLRLRLILVLGIVTLAFTLWHPVLAFTVLTGWACITLLIASLMKLAAFLAFITQRRPMPEPARNEPYHQPVISILVPLFREREIAYALLRRLERLSYPKHLLDVVLILEEKDHVTRKAVENAALPHWIRVIVVPAGHPQTKPRAMNYALDFCRGEIIGIFDAEDAPAPDQLERVAERFADGPAELVCLQGVLDYYNARQNWLSRAFTIEYATWFRVMMPGMARLGFAIPLGGTTLYFKRDALEQLGGWDAHNVTEDADLGFRLARHGYRTEMLHTTTREEANCHLLPWVKQRSRWLKGYMVTYLVHMRRPGLLLNQLGPWKFLGFQMHFVTALSQFILAPLLWSIWLIVLGLPHPLTQVVSPELIRTMGILFMGAELCGMIAALVAVSGPAHRHLMFWVSTMHFYFPLGVLAAYKALYELVFAPFYWDKTQHGHSLPAQFAPPITTASPRDQAVESSFNRVTNALEM
jgi:cellulose synthase/poly-beta-1,6-N-acetylglucosamine synthase-like glycosyltransferase